MKQTVFFAATFGRSNVLKSFVLSLFFAITSFPRLLLEVFVRRRFGTGYFSLFYVIILLIPLLIMPYLKLTAWGFFNWETFFKEYTTWYLFAVAFAYKSWKHYLEIRLKPGEFDLTKHSQYSGDKDFRFYQLSEYGINVTPRLIATVLEPAMFLVLGLFLILIDQPIGYIITNSCVIYSLGYFGAFHLGDIYYQEIIDKLIISQELSETCMKGKYPRDDKGFEYFNMSHDPDHLKNMASFVTDQNEFAEVR